MIDFTLHFPAGFLWGAATAAHQVEGGNTNNNWYEWEHAIPSPIFQGQRAGRACDWWGGRYREDFDRAASLHHNAHRFSVEWSRIEPQPGKFDDKALDFYAQMVGALRERRMEPMVTLHHFTNPLWLEKIGGWLNPAAVGHFERFVRRVVEALGDQVTMWCTINEPMVYASQGYLLGRFPPGRHNPRQAYRVAENLLRAHAAAYHTIKALRPGAQVGLAKHMISLRTRFPHWLNLPARNFVRHSFNRAFVLALRSGELRFPLYKAAVPEAVDTLDWIGLNYYYRFMVHLSLIRPHQLFLQQTKPRDGIQGPGDAGEIWPEGLMEHIKWLCQVTEKPLYVTENGVPDPDDSLRPLHMIRSLHTVWHAINFNYPVKGYFWWTLVDNFEWSEGYDPRFRFGLYGNDPATQVRTRRPSADLYGEICAANALTADMARRYIPDQFDTLFPGVNVQAEVQLPSRETESYI